MDGFLGKPQPRPGQRQFVSVRPTVKRKLKRKREVDSLGGSKKVQKINSDDELDLVSFDLKDEACDLREASHKYCSIKAELAIPKDEVESSSGPDFTDDEDNSQMYVLALSKPCMADMTPTHPTLAM